VELLVLILAIVALAVPFVIESLKRPRIEMKAERWVPQGPVQWTFAVVHVRVRPLPRLIRSVLVRESAAGCTATVEFRQNGELVMPEVPARWSSRPEPVRLEIRQSANVTQLVGVYVPENVPQTKTLDLAPGRWEEVAVAILRDDGEAFAFGAESYAHNEWRNPAWKLDRGVYVVTVRVEASGLSASGQFRLDNLAADFNRFRLTAG